MLPIVGLTSSVLGLASSLIAIWAEFALACPPSVARPSLTRFLGRFVFFEFQANCFFVALFGVCTAAALQSDAPALDHFIVRTYPLAFMLGCWLTGGYYAVEHFSAEEQRRRKVWSERGYPHVHAAAHLTRLPSGAASLLLATSLRASPSFVDMALSCGGFLLIFIYITVLNRMITGEWAYQFLLHAQRQLGVCGAALALLVTCLVGFSWGYLGKLLVEARVGSNSHV